MQPLAKKSVHLAPPSVVHSDPKESSDHIAHVLLISSDSHESKSDPPIPVVQESPSPIPTKHGGNHMILPPSSFVIFFDWGPLTAFRLPSYVPFQITVQAYYMVVHSTILDEGASVSIMSSTTWKALGSPQLVPVTQNLLAFNGGTSQPLGILLKFPITLGGKTVYIDVVVVQSPLDFNLLLGRDYVYVMGALVSSLFRVVCFPHIGRIMTIDKLTFIGHQSSGASFATMIPYRLLFANNTFPAIGQLCGYPFHIY